mmetsp:Transcript_12518/g.38709  ORF Transcript_12518/g.38709 Transcript_12518/m.38709 type:complete len:114 (+) Transcript_12518:414-755(+)
MTQLYKAYKGQGLEILAFPCNQFGAQEPGTDAEIKAFAAKYGAEYPMFSKVEVNGPNAHPVWKWAKDCKGGLMGSDIKWNFGKFLLDKDGHVYERYAPTASPMSIEGDIKKLL